MGRVSGDKSGKVKYLSLIHIYGKLEQEADRFASELLLPLHELEGQLKHPPSIDTVRRIATHYGTSLTATALKVVEATCEPRSQENRKRLRTTNPPPAVSYTHLPTDEAFAPRNKALYVREEDADSKRGILSCLLYTSRCV